MIPWFIKTAGKTTFIFYMKIKRSPEIHYNHNSTSSS